jgi:hypothetical protein
MEHSTDVVKHFAFFVKPDLVCGAGSAREARARPRQSPAETGAPGIQRAGTIRLLVKINPSVVGVGG